MTKLLPIKLALVSIMALLTTSCSTFVPILGSNRGWSDESDIRILHDISVSNLRIRVTTPSKNIDCVSGEHHTIEINGPINNDTSFVLERILGNLPQCTKTNGKTLVKTVYLN